MKVRERANRLGLIVFEHAGGFLVTNKYLKEWPAADLDEVDRVLREQKHETYE